MLERLWSHFATWDQNDLNNIIDILVEAKWSSGLTHILQSDTTSLIFSSLHPIVQA